MYLIVESELSLLVLLKPLQNRNEIILKEIPCAVKIFQASAWGTA